MLRRGVWASCLEFEFESRDQIRDDSYGNWSGASCTCSREISRSGQLRNPDRVPGFPLVIGKRLLPARGPSTSVIPGKAEADGLTGERLRDHLVKETIVDFVHQKYESSALCRPLHLGASPLQKIPSALGHRDTFHQFA